MNEDSLSTVPGLHRASDWDTMDKTSVALHTSFRVAPSGDERILMLESVISHLGPVPIAVVWFELTGPELYIWNSFVFEHLRRRGIRTLMHEELKRRYPEIKTMATGRATGLSLPWLLARGFMFHSDRDRWELQLHGEEI